MRGKLQFIEENINMKTLNCAETRAEYADFTTHKIFEVNSVEIIIVTKATPVLIDIQLEN